MNNSFFYFFCDLYIVLQILLAYSGFSSQNLRLHETAGEFAVY